MGILVQEATVSAKGTERLGRIEEAGYKTVEMDCIDEQMEAQEVSNGVTIACTIIGAAITTIAVW